jgi:hypothetical protein
MDAVAALPSAGGGGGCEAASDSDGAEAIAGVAGSGRPGASGGVKGIALWGGIALGAGIAASIRGGGGPRTCRADMLAAKPVKTAPHV